MKDLQLDIKKAKQEMHDKIASDRRSTLESPAVEERGKDESMSQAVTVNATKTKQDVESKAE